MIVNLPESSKVTIIGVSVKVRCKICGSIFGFYLLQDYTAPQHFDTCFKCEGRKIIFEGTKEKLNDGYNTIK